jgi:threonylcarbamoyladenosine tRNA methylthiotransferase MtaB
MKIFLDSVGCRLNQSEIESYANKFRTAGHSLVLSPDGADIAVINTCSVTFAADSDSRGKIRQAARSGVNQIIVTGCWSTLNPEQAAQLPGVTQIINNLEKDHLVEEVLQIPAEFFDLEPHSREFIPGARFRTRAVIKVQDGCNNHCTFCVTTIARGDGKSRLQDEILTDIKAALSNEHDENKAAKEIVLTGVHLGSWGRDLPDKKHLKDLIEMILAETDVPRLRLSSLEPWDLDGDFFKLWEDSRLCRHLHLPLQSGSRTILRRMARNTTPERYSELVASARTACPDIAITTDLIAGFPGETEREFEETVEFVRQISFSSGHVFTYSERPGTAAATMSAQVPHTVRKERNAYLRGVLSDTASTYQRKFFNQTLPVLWESVSKMDAETWHLHGLTDNYLRVHVNASQDLWNQITPVRLSSIDQQGFTGTI